MNKGEIYKITNNINNKCYIGQVLCYYSNNKKSGTKYRWKKHIYNAINNKNSCRVLENAIRKYGKDNFKIEKIEEFNIEILDEKEIYYIKKSFLPISQPD